jgi:hypothetical protein
MRPCSKSIHYYTFRLGSAAVPTIAVRGKTLLHNLDNVIGAFYERLTGDLKEPKMLRVIKKTIDQTFTN